MNNEETKEVKEEIKENNVLPKKKKKDDKLQKEIETLKTECALKDEKLLRLSAEMQNMKRRSEEERVRLLKYDGEKIILKMITILDSLEHAIKMDDNDLTDEVSKFLSGIKMIYGNMLETLKSEGVEEIECLHKPFDEGSMNAVLIDNDEAFENNIVLDVLQKGYTYKDKVLRPSMVKVNNKE